jgi:predicted transposase/invertase (TIGR01784 family)
MVRTIISLDYAIKNILRDKANFDILSGFLSELLERKVVVQEILESEGNIPGAEGKVNRLDMKAKIDNGELAVFEFQFFDQIDFLGKALFNACKAVVEQVTSGKLYDIKKVYSINIAYFDLGAKRESVFRATLNEFAGIHLNETIPFSQNINPEFPSNSIHPEYFLILPNKFDEQIKSKFDEWVYVLKTSTVRNEFTAAGVQEAGEKLDVMKMTPEERAEYEYQKELAGRQKCGFYTAEVKGKAIGRAEGLAEGRVEGKAEGRVEEKTETISNLLKAGMSLEVMAIATGLSQQEITEIIKRMNKV